MQKCSNCGFEFDIASDVTFCPKCGAKLLIDKLCPVCGAVCAPNSKFCNQCGASLIPSDTMASLESSEYEKDEDENYVSEPTENGITAADKAIEESNVPAKPDMAEDIGASGKSKTMRMAYNMCRYAPYVLLLVFSFLGFIFMMGTSIVLSPDYFGLDVNLKFSFYFLLSATEDSTYGAAIALLVLAVITLLAALFFGYKIANKQFFQSSKKKPMAVVCEVTALMLYLACLICAATLCGEIPVLEGTSGVYLTGSTPILYVTFSCIFLVLTIAALIAEPVLKKKANAAETDSISPETKIAPQAVRKTAGINKLARNIIFILYSVLLFFFYIAEFVNLQDGTGGSNLYTLLSDETYDVKAYMILLLITAIVSLVVSLVILFKSILPSIKASSKGKDISLAANSKNCHKSIAVSFISILLIMLIIIFAGIAVSKLDAISYVYEVLNLSCVGPMTALVLTISFLLLALIIISDVIDVVLNSMFSFETPLNDSSVDDVNPETENLTTVDSQLP